MRKLIVKEWMSLDGVIDSESMDVWYLPFHSDERADIIRNTILASDVMLYGRTTYEMLASYWPSLKNNEMGVADKLNGVEKYVVSTTLKRADWSNTTIINKNIIDQIRDLKNQSGKQILLDGSASLVQSLMDTDLIDEFQLLIHPYLMGKGKNFYKIAGSKNPLYLKEMKQISRGVVLLNYTTNQQRP
jgi:dihydrofolate reductase